MSAAGPNERTLIQVVYALCICGPIPSYPENVIKGVLDEPSTKCRYRIAYTCPTCGRLVRPRKLAGTSRPAYSHTRAK